MKNIQPTDLRIGNLVYFNGNHNHIGIITSLQPKIFIECCKSIEFSNYVEIGLNNRFDISYNIDRIKPIPLTDEWKTKIFSMFNSEFSIYWTKNKLDVNFSGRYLCSCDYVHEYQNVHFILTGHELTITK